MDRRGMYPEAVGFRRKEGRALIQLTKKKKREGKSSIGDDGAKQTILPC